MSLVWLVYVVYIVDVLKGLMIVVSSILITGIFFLWASINSNKDNIKQEMRFLVDEETNPLIELRKGEVIQFMKYLRLAIAAFIIAGILSVIIPPKGVMYTMVGAYAIDNITSIEEIGEIGRLSIERMKESLNE